MGERSDSEERIVSVYDEPKRRLQIFFYILLRDNLTAGAVGKIMEYIEKAEESAAKVSLDQGVEINAFGFSNDHISGYAWELVDNILGGDADRFAATRLERILDVIKAVEVRCMANDGPTIPTIREMREDEMRKIYELAEGSRSQ